MGTGSIVALSNPFKARDPGQHIPLHEATGAYGAERTLTRSAQRTSLIHARCPQEPSLSNDGMLLRSKPPSGVLGGLLTPGRGVRRSLSTIIDFQTLGSGGISPRSKSKKSMMK